MIFCEQIFSSNNPGFGNIYAKRMCELENCPTIERQLHRGDFMFDFVMVFLCEQCRSCVFNARIVLLRVIQLKTICICSDSTFSIDTIVTANILQVVATAFYNTKTQNPNRFRHFVSTVSTLYMQVNNDSVVKK